MMKLLLDTHTLIWWDSQSSRLSAKALQAITDSNNQTSFSVVSIWEMAIKLSLGKLKLQLPLEELVQQQLSNGLELVDIELGQVVAVQQLPMLHRDPFDRLLVAQAQKLQSTIVTVDPLITQFTVPTLW